MNLEFRIAQLSKSIKLLIGVFLFVLSIGFFTGISFVHFTTNASTEGIEENYLGNEDSEDAEVMKFKKSKHAMLNILHTHFLSMSVIFFLLGVLVYGTDVNPKLKQFLMLEPMLSVFFTFGGIYMVWLEYRIFSFVVMISGALMVMSFILSVVLVYRDLIFKK